jgi:hypothetical protein
MGGLLARPDEAHLAKRIEIVVISSATNNPRRGPFCGVEKTVFLHRSCLNADARASIARWLAWIEASGKPPTAATISSLRSSRAS